METPIQNGPMDGELERPNYVKIIFRQPSAAHPRGYIGASSSYAAQPGENWGRGNDLPDGPYTPETVDAIALAILALIEQKDI